jgi:hypothetical protein
MGRLACVGVLVVAAGCGRVGFHELADACPDACSRAKGVIDGQPADGQPDAPGTPMPTGTYAITPSPITYSCAVGAVAISFTQIAFVDSGSALTATSNDTGAPPQPCPMMGASAAGGHINVTCTLPGICNETYSLVGDFTGSTTWTGTFHATYAGTCLDCTAQMFAITGTR